MLRAGLVILLVFALNGCGSKIDSYLLDEFYPQKFVAPDTNLTAIKEEISKESKPPDNYRYKIVKYMSKVLHKPERAIYRFDSEPVLAYLPSKNNDKLAWEGWLVPFLVKDGDRVGHKSYGYDLYSARFENGKVVGVKKDGYIGLEDSDIKIENLKEPKEDNDSNSYD